MIYKSVGNILVLGGTGFIGSYYCKYSNYKSTIYKTSSKYKKGYIKFDLLNDTSNFNKIIEDNNIRKVVFLSAISNPQKCFENKKISNLVNIRYPQKIINILIKKKIYFIFFSSEYIFKGKNGDYTENTKANPDLLYGKQKNSIEKFLIKKKSKKFSIFRIAKTLGFKKNDGSIFSQFLKEQEKNKIIKVASNQIFNPLFILDLIKLIDFFISNEIKGKFNVCGDFKISRYGLIKNLSKKLKITNKTLIKVKLDAFTKYEKYPLNTSMKNTKIKELTKINFTNQQNIINYFLKNNKIKNEKR